MKFKKLNYATKYLIFSISILLVINIAASILLIDRSSAFLMGIIEERAFDIPNIVSSMIDGGKLEKINSEGIGSKEYQTTSTMIKNLQDKIKLKHIYCIKNNDSKKFTFLIDSNSGQVIFGTPVVYTDALYRASLGETTFDYNPNENGNGKLYSSYSPIFDASGKVTGIIAIGFSAEWYEKQIRDLIIKSILIVVVSLIICAIIVRTFSIINRERFKYLFNQLNILADNVEKVLCSIDKMSKNVSGKNKIERSFYFQNKNPNDNDIDILKKTIVSMQEKLNKKVEIMHKMAYTDDMTSLKNKTAYLQAIKDIDLKKIGTISYTVAVFDICSLKAVNDNFGHEYGDMLIINAANILKKIFDINSVYRFGGDEFIGIFYGLSEYGIIDLFYKFDNEISAFNQDQKEDSLKLHISKGFSVFNKDTDTCFKDVFERADTAMYDDKAKYYETTGLDRRR